MESSRSKILYLADACFEMYTLGELENVSFMLRELSYTQDLFNLDEILNVIEQAREWKRHLEDTAFFCH